MKTKKVIEYFGSVKSAAEALNCTRAAIYQWGANVPKSRQFEIEIISQGQLRADRSADGQAA